MEVILPDVNVLLYAFLRRSPQYARYSRWLEDVRRRQTLGLVDTVLLGVMRIASNPAITTNPAPAETVMQFIDALRASPAARTLAPAASTWAYLRSTVSRDRQIRGNLVPEAWLAALAVSHGARLATTDRGFGRFPGLDFFDPADAGSA